MATKTDSTICVLQGPNKSKYEVWLEQIGPNQAAKYLGQLGIQRKLSRDQVLKLRVEMCQSNWDDLNGDTIVFDADGRLLDGQHRLQAVVASKATIVTFCIKGVSADSYFSLDHQHKNRTLADLLGMLGEDYAPDLASCISYLSKYKEDQLGLMVVRQLKNLSNRNAIQLLKKHPGLKQSVAFIVSALRTPPIKVGSKGSLAFMYYVFSRINTDYARRYMDIMTYNSEKIQDDCPVSLCRNRLVKSFQERDRRNRMTFVERFAWMLKAWNYYITDRRMANNKPIRWCSGEAFPSIKDENGKVVSYGMIRKMTNR